MLKVNYRYWFELKILNTYIHIFFKSGHKMCKSNILYGKNAHLRPGFWSKFIPFTTDLWTEDGCHVWGKEGIRWSLEIWLFQKARKIVKIKNHVKDPEINLKGFPAHQTWGIKKNDGDWLKHTTSMKVWVHSDTQERKRQSKLICHHLALPEIKSFTLKIIHLK